MSNNISTTTTTLIWPPDKTHIKTIDQAYSPTGNTSLLTAKGFSFYSSASAEHGGDNNLLNPEDLLSNALSSCFYLTFFAISLKARLGLTYYESNSELYLGGEKTKFVEKIVLNLKMKFETPQTREKVLEICGKAHKYCVIANTIKSELEFNLELL